MTEGVYESPASSEGEEDLDIELSSTKVRMLKHYQETGEIKVQIRKDKAGTPTIQQSEVEGKEKKETALALSMVDEREEFGLEVSAMQCRVTMLGALGETPMTEEQIREREKKLKTHEKLIVDMIFELKLADATQHDLHTLMDQASKTFSLRKLDSLTISEDPKIAKTRLVKQLAQNMQILSQPRSYKKYCLKINKIETILASFSPNFTSFEYRVEGRETTKRKSVGEYVRYTLGRRSRNFQKYLKRGEEVEDGVSFSLEFKTRTLDLAAESTQARSLFLSSLKQLEGYLL